MKTLTIAGRIGKDAEQRTTGSGTAVCNFSVAVRGRTKGEEPTWVDCTIWGTRGEALAQYLTRGSFVAVTGSCEINEWTDREGNARTQLCISSVSEVALGPSADQETRKFAPIKQQEPPDPDIPF